MSDLDLVTADETNENPRVEELSDEDLEGVAGGWTEGDGGDGGGG